VFICILGIELQKMIDNSDSIIDRLKNGDRTVFEELYREYYIRLCYYCIKYVDRIEDAEEIVQDIFVKLWEKHEELEINSSISAYLHRAVQNYALNFLSKQKVKDKYILVQDRNLYEAFDDGLVKLEEEELRKILKKAILELPEKRREIFELSRFDGMKNSKIATQLSISVKTVETQMTKALKYLRIVLKDYVPMSLIALALNLHLII
jgi:RNA polymerase sigma-19 factor, ECF subfamily